MLAHVSTITKESKFYLCVLLCKEGIDRHQSYIFVTTVTTPIELYKTP